MKVYAGIVTFNPDLDRLSENLDAIIGQVDEVVVYDNASKNVEEVVRLLALHDQYKRISLFRSKRNGGMAVALNALCDAAYTDHAEYIVLLDQDSVVQEGMVSAMLQHAEDNIGILCPRITDRNDAVLEVPEADVEDLKEAITSGALVKLAAWKEVGGYDENLFVDWVDHEFCDNLIVHGYRVVAINDAVLLHEIGKKEYIGYGWTFEPGKGFYKIPQYSNERPYSRRYDMMFGQSYTAYKYRGTTMGPHEKWMLFAVVVHNIIREKHRLEFFRAMRSGIADGRRRAKETKNG